MPVYSDGFENEICCKGDQGNYMPDQMRLPFLDVETIFYYCLSIYFHTLFCIRLLCFWICIVNSCFGVFSICNGLERAWAKRWVGVDQ